MSKVHDLKTLSRFFHVLYEGLKTAELRLNDRNFQVGDELMLREWDMDTGYSGFYVLVTVTHIVEERPYLMPNYVMLSFHVVKKGYKGIDKGNHEKDDTLGASP